MYVVRHMRKFIKTRPILARPSGRPPIINCQNEIVEMYLVPEGVVGGVERGDVKCR